MYGTIAEMHVRAGMEDALAEIVDRQRARHHEIPGYLMSWVFRSDADPDEYWLVAIFQDKETYTRNADSPEQDEEYQMIRALLTADPVWHDGEVVHTDSAES